MLYAAKPAVTALTRSACLYQRVDHGVRRLINTLVPWVLHKLSSALTALKGLLPIVDVAVLDDMSGVTAKAGRRSRC